MLGPSMSFFKSIPLSCLSLALLALMLFSPPSEASDNPAHRLLEGIRLGTTLQHGKLDGHLRKDGKRTPLSLHLRGEDITVVPGMSVALTLQGSLAPRLWRRTKIHWSTSEQATFLEIPRTSPLSSRSPPQSWQSLRG